ncbi:MAG: hypothetical protein WCB68_23315 [Pyrinomonadaceae bacterium]
MSIDRPYVYKLSLDLYQLAEENWDNPSVLEELFFELRFRRRKLAVSLRSQIVERLRELQENFHWPSTKANIGSGKLDSTKWPDKGLLSFMGYTTGLKGANEDSRRDILDFIYTENVLNVTSVEYMQKWGKPNTGKRLFKLARTLARLTQHEKRKDSNTYMISIAEREADLKYLKKKYYIGRYDFTWPRTDV